MKVLGIAVLAACCLTSQTKDWAGLIRYGSENAELRAPKANEDRVVFLGDQVTELWAQSQTAFFPGKPFLNRGIGGWTPPQLLLRILHVVSAPEPNEVVSLARLRYRFCMS